MTRDLDQMIALIKGYQMSKKSTHKISMERSYEENGGNEKKWGHFLSFILTPSSVCPIIPRRLIDATRDLDQMIALIKGYQMNSKSAHMISAERSYEENGGNEKINK
eukprot:TRINITY_DN2564_c0_g1_i1.p1 TRINITY_DN2564_c0_g1~~TRINITY_DN2564_c0_g1_i1.p1  ORF type:complete len:107 (-),score=6.41 TRINITY_DN2564_c0_g1_i1:128-448(-)